MHDLRLSANFCNLLNTVEFILFTVVPESTSTLKRIFLTLKSLNNDSIVLWELQKGAITGHNKSYAWNCDIILFQLLDFSYGVFLVPVWNTVMLFCVR